MLARNQENQGAEQWSWKPAVLFCFLMSIIRPFYCFSFSCCQTPLEKKSQTTNSAIPHGLRRRHLWHFIRTTFLLFGYFILQQRKRTLKWEQITLAEGCLCREKTSDQYWALLKSLFSASTSTAATTLWIRTACVSPQQLILADTERWDHSHILSPPLSVNS